MSIVLTGVRYRGEPVYRKWNDERTRICFFSREVKLLKSGGWKFVKWVPLHEVKIERSAGPRRALAALSRGLRRVLTLPGISQSLK